MAKHRSSHEINEFRKTAKKLTAERTAYAQAEIAKRARMEKALAGERPHLQAGLQHMPIAVVLAEVPGGNLVFGKEACERLFRHQVRYSQSEKGYAEGKLLNPDGSSLPSEQYPLLRSVTEREVVEDKGMVIERGDGAPALADVHASPILRAEGKAIAAAGTMRDVTERKKAGEELGKHRDALELLAEERTAMLSEAYDDLQAEIEESKHTEEQLRQAHTMEAIRTLAGGIAHEFNNMLAVIMGNAELALDDLVEEGRREHLNQILKASERSRDLVRQILTFSRRNGGQERALKMVPLLRETYKLLRASLPRTIQMDLKLRTKSDTIFADPSLVRQVVVNLANNAAYAMREAGGILTIGLSSITLGSDSLPDKNMRPGCYVKLTVKDTGSGIAPDVQRRIFEPFFTTKGQGQGTGMGLSVVYGIVQSYHGMIEVESAAGLGSTFTVFLPESDARATIDEQEEASPCPRREHVLFVDDEPAVVRMTKTMLERMGYRVTALTDSSEALKVFTGNPDSFDLIITDQTMPDMTGIALAKEVLAVDPDMPIILCTGYSETVSPVRAKEAGIREFLMKPAAKKEMAQAIRSVLEQEENIE